MTYFERLDALPMAQPNFELGGYEIPLILPTSDNDGRGTLSLIKIPQGVELVAPGRAAVTESDFAGEVAVRELLEASMGVFLQIGYDIRIRYGESPQEDSYGGLPATHEAATILSRKSDTEQLPDLPILSIMTPEPHLAAVLGIALSTWGGIARLRTTSEYELVFVNGKRQTVHELDTRGYRLRFTAIHESPMNLPELKDAVSLTSATQPVDA